MQPERKNLRCVSVLLCVLALCCLLVFWSGLALAQDGTGGAGPAKEGACWQPIGPALATDWYVRQIVASPEFAKDQTLFAATGSNNLNDTSLEGVFAS